MTGNERRAGARPWWQTGVIYQIYPRSFQDSNRDGVGDLAGILARLDYLAWLGVDAIWLSPIFPSPMADFGYDVSDYTAVDPVYGDLATFDALVARAHTLGMRVLLDFVANHTSDQHPWFRESRSSRTSPKRDWYTWRDAKPDGAPPNNWLSSMGGSAWEWDPATSQYYFHQFLKEQPDLDWRNPEVRAAMHDVLRFWLARGVDGFRLDAIYYIAKDPALADAPPNPRYDPAKGEYDRLLHQGHDKDHPDIHHMLRELRQVTERAGAGPDPLLIGEAHLWEWERWASYFGANLDELHMPYNFAFTRGPFTAAAARAIVENVEAATPRGAWPNYVLGNHDESRIASRIGPKLAPLALLLLLTLRGTPTLYYGDELGMRDVEIAPDRVRDPVAGRVPGHGRDPERTPMQWSAEPNAGFCPPGVEPWLPVAGDYSEVNVARERDDARSLLSLTHRILALRRRSPALSVGSYAPVGDVPADVFAYLRTEGSERYLVALNFADDARSLSLASPGSLRATLALSTCLDREGPLALDRLVLRGHEGCVARLGAHP
jgi:alpha-glucosidase